MFTTFLRVHSNSKEVFYLSWQNMYPNLITTSHIKLKIFLLTKLLENLLLVKYLISATTPLITAFFAIQICAYSLSRTFLRKNGYSFKKSIPFIFKKTSLRNKKEEIELKSVAYTLVLAILKCKVCKLHIRVQSRGSPEKACMLTINSQ